MFRRRKASRAAAEPHPLDVIVAMSDGCAPTNKSIVIDIALDMSGGGLTSSPVAIDYLQAMRTPVLPIVTGAVNRFSLGMAQIAPNETGVGTAYGLFVVPLVEAASTDRPLTRTEREVMGLVFDGRVALGRFGMHFARAVVSEGSFIVLGIPKWCSLTSRALDVGDPDAVVQDRRRVRERLRELIAKGPEAGFSLGDVMNEAAASGLTELETKAAVEREVNKIKEQRDEVLRRASDRLPPS